MCSVMPCKNSACTKCRMRPMSGSATSEATTTAAIEMNNRLRSSARCSVKVISTSSETGCAFTAGFAVSTAMNVCGDDQVGVVGGGALGGAPDAEVGGTVVLCCLVASGGGGVG